RLDVVNYISHGIVKYADNQKIAEWRREFDGDEAAESLERPQQAGTKGAEKEKNDALSQYCVNLNKKAESGKTDILVGREDEVERTIQILCRRTKNNPL